MDLENNIGEKYCNCNIDYEIKKINETINKNKINRKSLEIYFCNFMNYLKFLAKISEEWDETKNENFYIKHIMNNYIGENIIDNIFDEVFKKNIKTLSSEEILFLIKTMSGIKVLEKYLILNKNNIKLSRKDTCEIFAKIGRSFSYVIYSELVNLINKYSEIFDCDLELLNLATFIPLNNYIFYNINKNKELCLSEEAQNNILSYSHDKTLIKYVFETYQTNKNTLFSSMISFDISQIIETLNLKINIEKDTISNFFLYVSKLKSLKKKKIILNKNTYYYEKYKNTENYYVRFINIEDFDFGGIFNLIKNL